MAIQRHRFGFQVAHQYIETYTYNTCEEAAANVQKIATKYKTN